MMARTTVESLGQNLAETIAQSVDTCPPLALSQPNTFHIMLTRVFPSSFGRPLFHFPGIRSQHFSLRNTFHELLMPGA